MAVLFNTTAKGSHIGTFCLIYRVLRRSIKTEMTVVKLTALCAPDTLPTKVNHKKKFPDMLDFWKKDFHKVWSINENQKLSLVHVTDNKNPTPEEISKVVRSALFKSPIEDITCAKKDNKYDTEPLFISLSCLLSCEKHGPFDKSPLTKETIAKMVREWLGTDYTLNNDEFSGFIEWLLFLGFANLDDGDAVVDPTRVVKDSLIEIFNENNTMPIRDFIASLGVLIPVFDGGDYHKQTISVMKNNRWDFDYNKKVSSGLSLALQRLEVGNVITLNDAADDVNAIEMGGLMGMPARFIASITFRGISPNA